MQRRWLYAIAALAGAVLGLSAYTFVYAGGFSYLDSSPEGCARCHAMRTHREAWLLGGHHRHATCSDCHAPHGLAQASVTGAQNAWERPLRFARQDSADPIRLRAAGSEVLEANCVRCHRQMAPDGNAVGCVRCHPGTGHAGAGRIP